MIRLITSEENVFSFLEHGVAGVDKSFPLINFIGLMKMYDIYIKSK